ncbi:hypothetical protein AVEN_167379-1 [Araneus ventricosus]|uniref:Uncharacterized protein n=1 Tax=Araneus ventricosus TaxID=182803 RepID=A0A4Y2LXE9_ARAVE|nr:hypothetical protein AVEN_167379-1 [Araneus ventricosus]
MVEVAQNGVKFSEQTSQYSLRSKKDTLSSFGDDVAKRILCAEGHNGSKTTRPGADDLDSNKNRWSDKPTYHTNGYLTGRMYRNNLSESFLLTYA